MNGKIKLSLRTDENKLFEENPLYNFVDDDLDGGGADEGDEDVHLLV